MAKNFCVIGAQVSQTWDRTWFDDLEGAEDHAKGLARKSYQQNQKPVTLFVVERKKVIELGMPEIVTREPKDSDDPVPGKSKDKEED